MAIAKDPKVIMNEKEFVDRLTNIKNRKTFYKNKYPYNLCYVNSNGKTSADCVNLVKAILNGYDVHNTKVGYYQKDLSNTGDCTESELLAQCTDVSQDFKVLGDRPEILYQKGHIGVYIGKRVDNRWNVIECTTNFGGGVVYSWVDQDGTRRSENGGKPIIMKDGTYNRWTHHGKPTRWVCPCNASESPVSNEKSEVNISNYPVLKKGSTGEYVKILQQLLAEKGYSPYGDFGSVLDDAVRKFQRNNGLEVDGCVGPKTWKALTK